MRNKFLSSALLLALMGNQSSALAYTWIPKEVERLTLPFTQEEKSISSAGQAQIQEKLRRVTDGKVHLSCSVAIFSEVISESMDIIRIAEQIDSVVQYIKSIDDGEELMSINYMALKMSVENQKSVSSIKKFRDHEAMIEMEEKVRRKKNGLPEIKQYNEVNVGFTCI